VSIADLTAVVADALRRRSPSTPEAQARVALDALSDALGAERYWMSTRFEREGIVRDLVAERNRYPGGSLPWNTLTDAIERIERRGSWSTDPAST